MLKGQIVEIVAESVSFWSALGSVSSSKTSRFRLRFKALSYWGIASDMLVMKSMLRLKALKKA